MSNEIERITVEKTEFVNQATLELLQRRMEARVRSDFLKAVTLPIGGGGVVAVLMAVLLWLPQKIEGFIKDPTGQKIVSDSIQEQVAIYLNEEDARKDLQNHIHEQTSKQIDEEVRSQLPSEVQKAIAPAVKEFFESNDGRTLVQDELSKAARAYFATNETQTNIQKQVDEFLKKDGMRLLTEKVDAILRPAVDRVGDTINQNRNRYVSGIEPQSLLGVPKASVAQLAEYMLAENVRSIKKSELPIVLTKSIGPLYEYDKNVIKEYFDKFNATFGQQFKFVSVSYAPEGGIDRLLALIPAKQFETELERSDDLLRLLNSGGAAERETENEIRSKLESWFGPTATRHVHAAWKVFDALKSDELWDAGAPIETEVAVVDAEGHLTAITSRRRLVKGLLE